MRRERAKGRGVKFGRNPKLTKHQRQDALARRQCTPDFFGFNAQDELQYRGRLDASRIQPVANTRRDLFEAMKQIAETGHGPLEQMPSMGCSIKWKYLSSRNFRKGTQPSDSGLPELWNVPARNSRSAYSEGFDTRPRRQCAGGRGTAVTLFG